MRLFVALEIPDAIRNSLAAFIAKMKGVCPEARWVRPEGVHITLKFVGEVAEEKRREIEGALEGIQVGGPVTIRFHGTGFFPNEKRPRVFWAGSEASDSLKELVAGVEERLAGVGIPREQRPFQVHLTMARFDSTRGVAELQSALAREDGIEFGAMSTGEMWLFRSELLRGGARYTKLRGFAFAAGSAGSEVAQ